MIGVVVATHGKLAKEMIRTAEAVVGRLDLVVPVSVVATSPDMRGDLKAAIQRVDQGAGVLKLSGLRASGKGIRQIAHDLAEAGQRSIGHLSDSMRRIG